jgi:FixJ family two-component response regulator
MAFPERFSDLPEYAFPRLRALLDGHEPGGPAIAMSIGEPRHPVPGFVADVLASALDGFARYPANDGTPALLDSISGWAARRYGVHLARERLMALNGTREGLFNAALALCPETKGGVQASVLMPNPFYQVYTVAARARGARSVPVDATEATGHLPDYAALDPALLDSCALAYICSPANPQGAVADRAYWRRLLALAERHDFRILADECYAEIYRDTPPPGILEVAQEMGTDPERVLSEAALKGINALENASCLAKAERQTGTILMVEDEEPLRGLLAEVLEREGHTVITMSDAKTALAWASGAASAPDLLLTDYDLHGGRSGLKLSQDLPDILGQSVPTVILTGDITTETLKAISASPCHQVTKPVMPEVLLATISDLMRKARVEKNRNEHSPRQSGTAIHVIDDDPVIREAMRRLFEAENYIVTTYPSAEDFLDAPRPEGAACVLIDNLLPEMDGVTLIDRLRVEKTRLPTVMLTGYGDAAIAVAAMKAGAADLIEKPASAAELLASVRNAIASAKYGKEEGARGKTRDAARLRFNTLTKREREVMAMVLEGAPNKIIAADMGINQRTVENHRAAVMRKTRAASLPELVRLALLADVHKT